MKFENKERKLKELQDKLQQWEDDCKLFAECDSWEEFELKRTAYGNVPKFKLLDPFWRYYCWMDNGRFKYICKFWWPTMLVPIVLATLFSIICSSTFVAMFLSTFSFFIPVILCGPIEERIYRDKFSDIGKAAYKLAEEQQKQKNKSAYINSTIGTTSLTGTIYIDTNANSYFSANNTTIGTLSC